MPLHVHSLSLQDELLYSANQDSFQSRYVNQASLELAIFCLGLLSTGTAGVYFHTWLMTDFCFNTRAL